MKHKLHFTIPVYTEENDAFPIPENESYEYWVPLMENFIEQSNAIEIHCWNEEKDIIKETALLFINNAEIVKEDNLTIIKGSITEEISNHLLYENLNTIGRLKWFSIFLIKNNAPVFQAEHWGTEFFVSDISEETAAFIKSVMPTGTDFYMYV